MDNNTNRNSFPEHENSKVEYRYFNPQLFNELTNNKTDDIFIIYQNIRLFNKNINELEVFIYQLNATADVIILSETSFNEHNTAHLPGYIEYHTFRRDWIGGGISISIRDHFSSTLVPEYTLCDEISETISICVNLSLNYRLAITGVYRPPNTTNLPLFMQD